MNNKINRMKPFLPLENITFDTLEQPIHEHPVIIFYDEYTERYWYLKARSKYDRNGNVKVKYRGEIEVPRNKRKRDDILFLKDSYIAQ
ncbi:Mbov_0400 family ICE element protein [Mycoplasmopsis felis]|uniref:Mbov_0400 family ICE element protein n=1 Tax=Mycoplasmopsis felis TaxID=33923 RepID=UPI003A4D917C